MDPPLRYSTVYQKYDLRQLFKLFDIDGGGENHPGYAIEFTRVPVDRIHHGKEDLLFALVRKAGGTL